MSEWKKWDGDKRPPTIKNVDIIFRDGEVYQDENPIDYIWEQTDSNDDIVFYREHDSADYGYKIPESEAQKVLRDRFSETKVEAAPESTFESTEFSKVDLEESIMRCWGVVEEIQDVYELTEDGDMDQIQNALLGLKELTDHKFQKLWVAFEESLKS